MMNDTIHRQLLIDAANGVNELSQENARYQRILRHIIEYPEKAQERAREALYENHDQH